MPLHDWLREKQQNLRSYNLNKIKFGQTKDVTRIITASVTITIKLFALSKSKGGYEHDLCYCALFYIAMGRIVNNMIFKQLN